MHLMVKFSMDLMYIEVESCIKNRGCREANLNCSFQIILNTEDLRGFIIVILTAIKFFKTVHWGPIARETIVELIIYPWPVE